MRYVAFIHRDDEPGFGISFPDFPGCVSDGDTREDAIRRGREALAFHLEGMADDGEAIPPPRSLREIEADPELAEWRQGAEPVCINVPEPPVAVEAPNDPFLHSLGRIFGRSLACMLEPFLVPDLPLADSRAHVKAIFILESPHTDEVASGYPLAGASGRDVAEIIGRYLPTAQGISGAIGELVSNNEQCLSWLGIVNACRLPLQENAYIKQNDIRIKNRAEQCKQHPGWKVYIESLDIIKNGRGVGKRNEAAILLERAIAQDLQRRLCEFVYDDHILHICCGGIAQRIFERTSGQDQARVAYAPHPSRRQWKCAKYLDGIREIFESIESDLRTGGDA